MGVLAVAGSGRQLAAGREATQELTMFMPDISDVGPPAKGPGLPERIPDATPPPVKVRIEHGRDCKEQEALKSAILKEVPEADVEFVEGEDDSYEIEINGKLIFSKDHLGEFPDNAEIVEISKWGNMGKSFLHMYLCSVAEGGQQRMIITDKKNTPLPKRMIMLCVIS